MEKKYDSDLEKIHDRLYEIFKEFKLVCDKHNIPYLVAYGSMLGAVRHNGFIPWDDDFDVAMRREDYDKFLKVCEEEFNESSSVFVQNYMTDEYFPHTFTRLGLRDTIAVQRSWQHAKFEMPLFIDVFVYDKVPSNSLVFKIQKFLIRFLMNLKRYKSGVFFTVEEDLARRSFIKRLILKIPNDKNIIPMRFLNKLQDRIQQWGNTNPVVESDSEYSNFYMGSDIGIEKSVCKSKDFTNIRQEKFRDLDVPIPENYDKILTRIYGDYMKYPPIEDRVGNHDFIKLKL